MKTTTPQSAAAQAESSPSLPNDTAERFAGYAVMGMPFSSGHYLAFRRFPASSIGPGYHAVWLRSPDRQWTVHADAPPEVSCARYFGAALREARYSEVTAEWTGPWQLTVRVPGVVHWELGMKATATTAAVTAMARRMPPALWRNDGALGAMGRLMGPVLGVGKLAFAGLVPNGQSFQAKPMRVWAVTSSRASIRGVDAGVPQPFPVQDRLADFWLPQRGLFVAELSLRFPSTAGSESPTRTVPRTESRES
ncbi:MAG: hypothetical protein ABIN10_01060 [Specibacter sp.]